MLVSDILNLMANLGIGLDEPTVDDEEIFLRYLNLAHFDLYRKTAPVNPYLALQRDILDVTDGVVSSLTQSLFDFRSVYQIDINRELLKYSLDKVQHNDPGLQVTGDPHYWYYSNNTLNVWPLATQIQNIGALYSQQPILLTLDPDIDLSTYYPVAFHPLLVDGASYYLFQTETGFKNPDKMQRAAKRWDNGKSDIYSYLLNISGKTLYSTYSKI